MDNLFISLFSVLVGVGATVLASRHYYRRSVDKELTPFIQLQSNVLSHIESDVKSDLHIEYRGTKVENLQQLQVLMANTGERAIRDVIKPLRLELPENVEIMDASILYVSPEGRDVSFNLPESTTIEFNFPLLNKDEFFIFKLLLKGAPKRNELKFGIVASDLPPKLAPKRLTYRQIEGDDKNKNGEFEFGLLFASLLILLLALCTGVLSYYAELDAIPDVEFAALSWINQLPIVRIASIAGYILTGFFTLIGGMALAGAIFGNFEFPKSKKFKVPKEYAAAAYGFRSLEGSVTVTEMHTNKPTQPTADASAD